MLTENGTYTLLLLGQLRSSKEKDSSDPMWHKYPHLTPYAYCTNNPVMLVDPDGRETKHFFDPKEQESETNELLNLSLINAANYFASIENNNAIHIYAHGNSEGIQVYLGEEQGSVFIKDVDEFQTYVLSKFDMWNNRKEGENITIVLHSCSTGQGGENSFAAKMSKGLENTTILAPDKKLAVGKGYEEVYNMKKFNGYGGLQKNRGRWIQYNSGKRVDSHSPKTYWNNIRDNINEVGVMDKVLDFCIENFVEKL